MIQQRLITAAIALPFLAFIIYTKNPILFPLFLFFITAVGQFEFQQMVWKRLSLKERFMGERLITIVLGLLIFALPSRLPYLSLNIPLLATDYLVFCGFFFGSLLLIYENDIQRMALKLSSTIVCWIYIPILLQYVERIHGMEKGSHMLFFFLFIIMSCDTGAYFIGKRFGRHKLSPIVSPNKTIEGALGGSLVASISAIILGFLLFPERGILYLIILSLCTSIAGQFGDLLESMIKRYVQVKDSGRIFYGHGGMLDRLDSILLGSIVFYTMHQALS